MGRCLQVTLVAFLLVGLVASDVTVQPGQGEPSTTNPQEKQVHKEPVDSKPKDEQTIPDLPQEVKEGGQHQEDLDDDNTEELPITDSNSEDTQQSKDSQGHDKVNQEQEQGQEVQGDTQQDYEEDEEVTLLVEDEEEEMVPDVEQPAGDADNQGGLHSNDLEDDEEVKVVEIEELEEPVKHRVQTEDGEDDLKVKDMPEVQEGGIPQVRSVGEGQGDNVKVEEMQDVPKKQKHAFSAPVTGEDEGQQNDNIKEQHTMEEKKEVPKAERKPNIVIMIADDVGVGDIGCFGNTTMKTPYLDQLAREGVKLTQNIAAASVCTPSRAALMTGRYPVRSGMAPSNIVRVNIFVGATGGLPAKEITMAELAKEEGYATAWIGKWHMGVHCGTKDFCHHPNKQGFDHFYGLPLTNLKDFGPDDSTVTKSRIPNIDTYLIVAAILGVLTAILFRKKLGWLLTILLLVLSLGIPALTYWIYTNMTVLNAVLYRNLEVVEQPLRLDNRLAARMANEATEFIDKQADSETPFLLVVGWIQAHTALHTSPEFTGVSAHGAYGDNVEEMDWSVGQVLQALKRNNLDDNTLVYFASDNGAHNEETGPDGSRQGGWNGIYRGGKAMGGMEGGIRVPGLARYPGKFPAGSVIDQPVSMMDMYPTAAGLMGASLPTDRTLDGVDILPLLKGDSETPPHEFLFHYCGVSLQAARYAPDDDTGNVWKVHYATPDWYPGTENCQFICGCYGNSVIFHDPPLMYNLATDPSERSPLDPTDATHAPILAKINAAVAAHRAGLETVEDQMSPLKLLPLPALQPCCGDGTFPNCDCAEPPFGDQGN